VIANLSLYKRFYGIYSELRHLVRPLSVERINMLHHNYNMFRYERTSTESRGLPHIDAFKAAQPHVLAISEEGEVEPE
jgi:hypothetical protein